MGVSKHLWTETRTTRTPNATHTHTRTRLVYSLKIVASDDLWMTPLTPDNRPNLPHSGRLWPGINRNLYLFDTQFGICILLLGSFEFRTHPKLIKFPAIYLFIHLFEQRLRRRRLL